MTITQSSRYVFSNHLVFGNMWTRSIEFQNISGKKKDHQVSCERVGGRLGVLSMRGGSEYQVARSMGVWVGEFDGVVSVVLYPNSHIELFWQILTVVPQGVGNQ